jgi:hypothetical protein
MFIAIVQIPMAKRPRDAAVEAAAKSAPTYTALAAKGLVKKYYLNGEAGGVEAAFGARPTVTYYDNRVVVDNETGKVHVDGQNT